MWPLYAVLGASLGIVVGLIWDISWHRTIGRDTFWAPPHLLDVVDERAPARPETGLEVPEADRGLVGDADHLAEDVELELLGRGVPDAHRPRPLVAG